MTACKSLQPVQSKPRICAQKLNETRARLFQGMYDGSSGFGTPGSSVVRCPGCKRTVGNVTGNGWRQTTCDTCGSTLMMRQLDRNGKRYPQVRLLNPDCTDEDSTARRFALLEIE